VLSQLQSDDWEANFEALSTVRRLALHHASVIDAVKVHTIISGIMKQVSNLRSSVSKNALMALESMCAAFSRAMDSEVESIVPVLLKRCADSNAFVCESAAASLRAVVLKCTTSRVVSALTSRASSKAAPIRREVARGIYALILGQADIQTSKDLPPVLQLVGRCLEDSNNEVRDIAKQAILHLHHIQRLPSERIKRFLSASAQSKVNSALSGKVAYVPQLLPKSSSLMEIASELPSSATKKRETTSAPKAKKTAKLSSRASPPASSNGTRLKMNSDELHRLEAKLDSNNWKDRFDALNETTNFICGCASALVESGQMLNLFDQLIKRLDDGNAKVNVLALECMERIVPAVGSGMEQILPNFVPAIAKNLANARTSSLALSVVRQLCAHADNRSLCQQFAIQARSANSRVIPALLDTLTQLTAHSLDDKNNYVLTRHVLPLAVDLLKEAKRLLRQLRRTLGPTAISNAASKLSSTQQDKLAAVLR
ncbi:CLASP N terminal, partial [Phytophthora infestans]